MMFGIRSHDDAKKIVEAEVIKAMQKQGYNLNTVNNYGENLLHISAANGCHEITKKILEREEDRRAIDRKNKFGWTPLMQAIRNGDLGTVKLLLQKNSSVNDSTYLGMSVLGLAAANSKEMFETVYRAYPNALASITDDDINPLCVAAMKNDKELFLKLLDFGIPLSSANEYTHVMMRNSTVPEIAALAQKRLIMEDYWDDTSDNIQVISEQDIGETNVDVNEVSREATLKDDRGRKKRVDKQLLPVLAESETLDPLSPALTYNCSEIFAASPNAHFIKSNLTERSNVLAENRDVNNNTEGNDSAKNPVMGEYWLESPPIKFRRVQPVQSADFDVATISNDPNVSFTPEFSPLRSPHVPADINEENVFGENTPTPPHCKTPPRGVLLNSQQTKMIVALRRYGLSRHIPVFLEQEVDIDLFLTLTNSDLIEIGIEHEEDRCALLEAINEYKRDLKYDYI